MKRFGLISLLVIAFVNVWGQTQTIQQITWVNADGGNNFDPTYFYREDDTTDAAKLKLRMGDEESSLFEVGFNYYLENGKWYRNFSISGSGIGYFRKKLGIGITSPEVALHVLGEGYFISSSSNTLSLKRSGTGNPGIRFDNDNGVGIANIYGGYQGNGGLKFRPLTGGVNDMNLDKDGKLGIKCYPDYTLTVNGNFKVYNGENQFSYNGYADLVLKYTPRGSGGRAIVHNVGNQLWINYAGDFSGGTRIGSNTYFSNTGNSFINTGKVGIGTTSPSTKLDVAGTIRAQEILVEANGNTADFVFSDDYILKSLTEVENYIKTHKHLPDIPSAEAMEKQGVNLAEMNKLLLQKVEELTLHTIAQEKKLDEKDKEVKELKEAKIKETEDRKKETEELKEKSRKLEERLAKLEALLIK